MAAQYQYQYQYQYQCQENHEHQNDNQEQLLSDHQHYVKLLSSYLGLSFAIFIGSLPKNSISLLSTLRVNNKALTLELMQAEEHLRQLHSRRKEDSKANARVVEIFASHRHAWQQEEKRLLQQIDEVSEEIVFLKSKLEEFESVRAELEGDVQDLKRVVSERDEMLNFVSRSNFEVEGSGGDCYGDMEVRYGKDGVSEGVELGVEECFLGAGLDEAGAVYGQSTRGYSSDFLNSAASKFWSEKASPWQDMHYESLESQYNMKHFVARDSPWKVDADSTGVSSKLKLLEQELLNLERIGKTDLSKVPYQMRKQAKRYQALAGKIDDLCRKMQASDPCEPTISSNFRTQRQTEFLLEAFRLKQRASETSQKLMALQTKAGKSYREEEFEGQAKLTTMRALGSIIKEFKEIQRNLDIWLARIIGDLEGILSRDGTSRVREYYISSPRQINAYGPEKTVAKK
ncbi:uncharacterized protein LOC142545268 isoform X2 [Primulina tabacum]|uniref:uncharacterized protein LOC142545268 isoform X2 n=1 Tax=Primulina tabacum TaxID=48773 RepID=UPI003F5A2BB1